MFKNPTGTISISTKPCESGNILQKKVFKHMLEWSNSQLKTSSGLICIKCARSIWCD